MNAVCLMTPLPLFILSYFGALDNPQPPPSRSPLQSTRDGPLTHGSKIRCQLDANMPVDLLMTFRGMDKAILLQLRDSSVGLLPPTDGA
ncbi:MAG TPA: hypothetical protein VJV58_07550 [Bradyrhizobium sp.]|uniref:hypothetical protein n=1 Tax=Bradyrhizobium sp. TaxID=376 RepID=UPI002B477C17|nr:hypothetical protein [Bradyrhizobium sp.]HKO70770.1 hypothetical protein [Bradyrhizobium sp.]